MSSPHGSRNLALANGLNAFSVIALLLFECRKAANTDVIYLLKTLSCYILFTNVLTAWTFRSRTNSFKRNYMVSQVLKRGFSLLVSVLCFHLILILFGASVVESSNETFYFSVLLALTSVFPCLLMVGPTVETWISKSLQDGSEKYVLMIGISSIVGAWFGAFVIPLDWDRWWQVWPVSCIWGNLIGYCCGLLITSKCMLQNANDKKAQKGV